MRRFKIYILLIPFLHNLYSQDSKYMCSDFHQHTTFSDGMFSLGYMMEKSNEFELDWWANSEHAGAFTLNGLISGADIGSYVYFDNQKNVTIKGDTLLSGSIRKMWRWQSLKEFSFSGILDARELYPDKIIVQGVEWYIPGHGHASVAVITSQYEANPNADALAQFEYMFDYFDRDKTGGLKFGWEKCNLPAHEKTLEAIRWMQKNYQYESWIIPNHVERLNKYTIADFRDFNNTGPDVCFGFEGMPGHQKNTSRGAFFTTSDGGGTYGGAGIYTAKIGGLWDALLSEGRKWWIFANSDYHSTSKSFYPGEYQKNYTLVNYPYDIYAITNGMRSGNTWIVSGDLIDSLIFTIEDYGMGTTHSAQNDTIKIIIKVRDPIYANNNIFSSYTHPVLDHIDLIAGEVTEKIQPGDTNYNIDHVSTTKIIARFDSTGEVLFPDSITSTRWDTLPGGWKIMNYSLAISKKMYFRLRGSNLRQNIALQTDMLGNPAVDTRTGNDAVIAFSDLWFYSNPIFINPKDYIIYNKTPVQTTVINIYPNPVKDICYISFDTKMKKSFIFLIP